MTHRAKIHKSITKILRRFRTRIGSITYKPKYLP